jgi:nucleoid DNA-binding protein
MIFAHTMDKHKLVPVKEGTVKTKVEALKTAAVKSAMVTIRGTPKHSVVTKKSRKGKVQTSSKEHPATGEEYFGYSVEVYADAVLIDEIFSQPSLKPMK